MRVSTPALILLTARGFVRLVSGENPVDPDQSWRVPAPGVIGGDVRDVLKDLNAVGGPRIWVTGSQNPAGSGGVLTALDVASGNVTDTVTLDPPIPGVGLRLAGYYGESGELKKICGYSRNDGGGLYVYDVEQEAVVFQHNSTTPFSEYGDKPAFSPDGEVVYAVFLEDKRMTATSGNYTIRAFKTSIELDEDPVIWEKTHVLTLTGLAASEDGLFAGTFAFNSVELRGGMFKFSLEDGSIVSQWPATAGIEKCGEGPCNGHWSAPVVDSEGNVYAHDNRNGIVKFDGGDLAAGPIWNYTFPPVNRQQFITTSPVLNDDETAVFGCANTNVLRLGGFSTFDGAPLFEVAAGGNDYTEYDAVWGPSNQALSGKGAVYFLYYTGLSSMPAKIRGFDAFSGEPILTTNTAYRAMTVLSEKEMIGVGSEGVDLLTTEVARTGEPTAEPSSAPSGRPTISAAPSSSPTASASPSAEPTASPSMPPSITPTSSPSGLPTVSSSPSSSPSSLPTNAPSSAPTPAPTPAPSSSPVVTDTSGSLKVAASAVTAVVSFALAVTLF